MSDNPREDDYSACATFGCDRPAAACLGHLGQMVAQAERMAIEGARAAMVEIIDAIIDEHDAALVRHCDADNLTAAQFEAVRIEGHKDVREAITRLGEFPHKESSTT